MIDLLQITRDPEFAARCDAIEGIRLFVDLERMGKAERQAGRNTFISSHELDDVARVKAMLRRARLMVRVNPLHAGSAEEVDAVLARGADLLMLPMFTSAGQLADFSRLVAGRAPIVPLVEAAQAVACVDEWIATPGLWEVFVGLNDLHLSMGNRFMYEPLARGLVDSVADAARRQGLRFGFGGIARLDEGLLPGRDVLAEHVRLGSQAVILSRTFHRPGGDTSFDEDVRALRREEQILQSRAAAQVQNDRERTVATIDRIASGMGQPA